jgi:hypothetical protein
LCVDETAERKAEAFQRWAQHEGGFLRMMVDRRVNGSEPELDKIVRYIRMYNIVAKKLGMKCLEGNQEERV